MYLENCGAIFAIILTLGFVFVNLRIGLLIVLLLANAPTADVQQNEQPIW
jgi:hypothetical protein